MKGEMLKAEEERERTVFELQRRSEKALKMKHQKPENQPKRRRRKKRLMRMKKKKKKRRIMMMMTALKLY